MGCLNNDMCIMVYCEHSSWKGKKAEAMRGKCNCHEYTSCSETRKPTNPGLHFEKLTKGVRSGVVMRVKDKVITKLGSSRKDQYRMEHYNFKGLTCFRAKQ